MQLSIQWKVFNHLKEKKKKKKQSLARTHIRAMRWLFVSFDDKRGESAAQVAQFLTVGCMHLFYLRSTYYTVYNGENGNCFISS